MYTPTFFFFFFYSTNTIDTVNEISRFTNCFPRKNENIDKNPRLKNFSAGTIVTRCIPGAINWQLLSMEITQCTIRVPIFTRMFTHRMEHRDRSNVSSQLRHVRYSKEIAPE